MTNATDSCACACAFCAPACPTRHRSCPWMCGRLRWRWFDDSRYADQAEALDRIFYARTRTRSTSGPDVPAGADDDPSGSVVRHAGPEVVPVSGREPGTAEPDGAPARPTVPLSAIRRIRRWWPR
jgi:hypothetical protein